MSLIENPCIYFEDFTISKEKVSELLDAQLIFPLELSDENGRSLSKVRMYIDNARALSRLTSADAEHYHYINSIKDNFHLILGAQQFYPTPQLHTLHATDNTEFINCNRSACVLAKHENKPISLGDHLSLKVVQPSRIIEALNLNCLWIPENVVKKMITINKGIPVTQYPNIRSFEYMDSLNAGAAEMRAMQDTLAKFQLVRPSAIAYFIAVPRRYYESPEGIESIIRNYLRNHNLLKDVSEFSSEMIKLLDVCTKDPSLKRVKNAKTSIELIINHVKANRNKLDIAINREWVELNSASSAYQIKHYENVENTVLETKTSGLIRFNPHEWITSASISLNNDDKNARYHNLLPEAKGYEVNKNINDKIKNSASLVGNCHVKAVPPAVLCRSIAKLQSSVVEQNIKEFKQSAKWNFLAPSISVHQAKLNDGILYDGYFEGIPALDNDFSDKLIKLIENEYAAKLSGIQFKLPMRLQEKNGVLELERQKGNEPFTHIAKFPMPGSFDDITLAEWLALHIMNTSNSMITANTQLVSFTNEHGQEYIPDSIGNNFNYNKQISERSQKFRNQLEDIFNEEVYAKHKIQKQLPPFLISERFDIPEAGQHYTIKARDFAELLRKSPEDKYNAQYEDVGQWIQQNISNTVERSKALESVIKQVFSSYILHNNDLHLKNLTLLEKNYPDRAKPSLEISPCYDVIVTPLVYPDNDMNACYQLALPANGTKFPTIDDLVICAETGFGYSKSEAREMFDQTLSSIKLATRRMKANIPHDICLNSRWNDVVTKGLNIISRNIKHIEEKGVSFSNGYEQESTFDLNIR